MNADIRTLSPKILVGRRIKTTAADPSSTLTLWKSFMPRLKEIKHKIGNDLYSLQVFDAALDFSQFSPVATMFDKWAAIEVEKTGTVPSEMEIYPLTGGLYAVFVHKGPASEGHRTFQYIYGTWIPASGYMLDNSRAHFGVMGEKYKNNAADSEEEIWIPIKN